METLNFTSTITIQPYGKILIIATPTNEEDIQKLEDQWSLLDEEKQLGGFHKIKYNGWNAFLIIFNLHHNQSISYGMISHEAEHVVDYLFESKGHEHNYENNEPGTYLLEWIVNEIFRHFIQKNILNVLSCESIIKNIEDTDSD